jgi:glycosyltransferase involved in cell wall biosynthesis
VEQKSEYRNFEMVAPPGAPRLAVFYDASRLVNRAHSRVATGIDRIDLRFARAVLDHHGEDCQFIVRAWRWTVLADRALIVTLVEALERIWFDGGGPEPAILRKIEGAGIRTSVIDIWPARPKSAAGWPAWLAGLVRPAGVTVRRWMRNALRRSPMPAITKLCDGRTGVYVNCSHTGLARRKGLLAALQRAGVTRTVAYIHDLIPIEYPEFTRAGQSQPFADFIAELSMAGAGFVANSKDTANRLEAYATRKGWPVGDVPVIYPGVEVKASPDAGETAATTAAAPRTTPYFVIVGTVEPRKNHMLLLRIWRDLASSGHAPMPHLHIVGKRGWENQQVFETLDYCTITRRHVTEHNDMTDRELGALMRGARALLFPSIVEGYGLPLAEAMAQGVPVIASNLPVFREVVGVGIDYLDPLNTAGWREAVLKYSVNGSPDAVRRASDNSPMTIRGWATAREEFVQAVENTCT